AGRSARHHLLRAAPVHETGRLRAGRQLHRGGHRLLLPALIDRRYGRFCGARAGAVVGGGRYFPSPSRSRKIGLVIASGRVAGELGIRDTTGSSGESPRTSTTTHASRSTLRSTAPFQRPPLRFTSSGLP